MILNEFKLEKKEIIPAHSHTKEQKGYLLSGHIIKIINGRRHETKS